jgi:eukaryotic-like serine/threonine-protein kinase
LPDIFVSYSREDQAVARSYAEGFEAEGFSVWWDQSLNPGEAFDQVTERALDEAKAVVVLWSKTSVNSRWVRAEATQANANNRLLPVMIEHCRRPIMFELSHTADLSQWTGDIHDPAWQAFLASVRRFVQRAGPENSAAPVTTPRASSGATQPGASHAKKKSQPLPRRKVLLYGASAVGLAAAGFAGGALLRGGPDVAPTLPPSFHRLTYRRGLIRSARFAPDGQTILYGALWDGDKCRVHSTRTDNPESRALDLPNASVLAVSRTGDLALSIGDHLEGTITYGTLARVPIAGGAPRELMENVRFADWSPDGAELAVIRNVEGSDQLEYPLGTALFQPKVGNGYGLGFVRISPDGKRLAFVQYSSPRGINGKVCIVDPGGKVEVLTDDYINIHGLAWKGDEVWYSASEDRPLFRSVMAVKPGVAPRIVARMPVNVTLWDVAADGRLLIAQTDDRAVMIGRVPGEPHDRDLSWLDASWVADVSPDGRSVLFSETGQGVFSVPAAYLRGLDGSPAVRLGSGQPLALSPDAHFALIRSFETAPGKTGEFLEVMPTAAGKSRRLPGDGFSHVTARWLPDGQGVVLLASEPGKPLRLYRVELPEGKRQPITPEGVRRWALSPDGLMIAATGPEPAIRLYPAIGGTERAVPGTNGRESLISWVEDGLLVMRLDDATAPRGEVYLMDPVTGRQRSWGNILPRDGAGIMSMVSFAATTDGGTCVFTWHRALSNLYIASGLA